MNGKTVEVDNTDAEGRLVLAGTLVFLSSDIISQQCIRRHLLCHHRVQAPHSDRCCNANWVSHFYPYICSILSKFLHTSACGIALGDVYSAVYSVSGNLFFFFLRNEC
jgi:hypothetical protein